MAIENMQSLIPLSEYQLEINKLNTILCRLRITQEDISNGTSISQSQISRILSGHGKRASKSFKKICFYVYSKDKMPSIEDICSNKELMHALASVWDGSANQAIRLASVIRSLGPLIHTQPGSVE